MISYAQGPHLLMVVFFSTVLCCPLSTAAERNRASIDRMKKDLFFLAGDECEGRGIETQGINKAADYIASAFKAIGLKPAMPDGSYFQHFNITSSSKLGSPNKLVLTGPLNQEITPKINADWAVSGLTSKGTVSAGLVFAGYGVTIPEYDDYKGIEVQGKIVIILRQTPRSGSKDAPFREAMRFAPLQEKITNAEGHKAAGVLFVSDRQTAGEDDVLMPFEYARGGGGATIPVFHVRRALVDQMFADGKSLVELERAIDGDLKPRSFELKNWTVAMQATIERTEIDVKNVIGVLEGKGPLAEETVVVGAHYDHLGRGERGSRSKGSKAIHYGADDNGSGTCAVIELARRFAAVKNREGRRIVFMTFSGEERGLYGSAYYCKKPVFPLEKTVVMINLDMVGRLRADPKAMKDKLEVGGIGSAKTFENLIDDLNRKYEFDIKKTRSGVGPSDHTSFYIKGVPVYFFFTGLHAEYHMPTDKPDTINLEGMDKIVNMVEELTSKISSDIQKPEFIAAKVNKDDPPVATTSGVPTIRFMPGDYDDDQSNGVLVGGVLPGGPAEKSGLKEGDWIVEIAGQPIKNMAGYMRVMSSKKGGEVLDFTVKRGDKKVPLKVTPLPPAKMKN